MAFALNTTISTALGHARARSTHCRQIVGQPVQRVQAGYPSQSGPAQQAAPERAQLQLCRAGDDRRSDAPKGGAAVSKFNPIYLGIIGGFTALLVFRNPYIYAALSILSILPQNSNVTSLNGLVLFFYETGLFMNFAEAVDCVRLVTWLSITYMLLSFAIFN